MLFGNACLLLLQEPRENVTDLAIEDWESKKQKLEESKGKARHSEHPSSSFQTDISEPIGTGKRKKPSRKSFEFKLRKAKRARTAGTSDTARFQTISQESPNSQQQPREIKDSYEEDISPSSELLEFASRARVEIPQVPSTLNRAAYYPIEDSQPSQKEYSQDQTDSTQSQPQTQSQTFRQPSSPRKLSWEEEDISSEEPSDQPVGPISTLSPEPAFKRPTQPKKVVIPDSQETGSSPSRASVIQADIGIGSLVATTQSSSRGVEATLISDSKLPGSSSFIPASEPSKDSPSQSIPAVSQPDLSLEVSSREETDSAPQVESVEQEQSLEEQGFQTQIPFSSQEREDSEVEDSELVVKERSVVIFPLQSFGPLAYSFERDKFYLNPILSQA